VTGDQSLARAYRKAFGADATHFAQAPGRVNLIGEHTDYNEGFVFPAAIDLRLLVAARAVNGPTRLVSKQLGDAPPFDVGIVHPTQDLGWAAYPAGMAWVLQRQGFEDLPNIEALVHGDIPIGSGVSSSAAIEMAFGVLWNALAGLGVGNREMALFGQQAENEFAGVNCGIMDQMACAMGRQDHAMFLDARSLEIEHVPIPPQVRIVLCDTGKRRGLVDSLYNERRSQCEEAARALGVAALRDAGAEDVERLRDRTPEEVYLRARHVVTENARCRAFGEALRAGDLACVGRLMRASHASLRDDFEVSCVELDAMAEAAWAAPGCVGARMTGAGFGGACVALVEAGRVEEFVGAARCGYRARNGLAPAFTACRASEGAGLASGL
jgi:galactokinase